MELFLCGMRLDIYLENVRNELIRGETGWSTFEEKEAKVMMEWML